MHGIYATLLRAMLLIGGGYRCSETSELKNRSATLMSIVFLIANSRCEHSVARWTISERLHPAAVRECSSQVASGRRTETWFNLKVSPMPPALFHTAHYVASNALNIKSEPELSAAQAEDLVSHLVPSSLLHFGKRSIVDPERELDPI